VLAVEAELRPHAKLHQVRTVPREPRLPLVSLAPLATLVLVCKATRWNALWRRATPVRRVKFPPLPRGWNVPKDSTVWGARKLSSHAQLLLDTFARRKALSLLAKSVQSGISVLVGVPSR